MAEQKKETIAMIRSRLAEVPTPEELLRWSLDGRLGVRQALQQYARRQNKVRQEHERLRALYRYEEHWYAQGKLHIAGTDEAGRGPVAGPVTVAAVILPPHAMLLLPIKFCIFLSKSLIPSTFIRQYLTACRPRLCHYNRRHKCCCQMPCRLPYRFRCRRLFGAIRKVLPLRQPLFWRKSVVTI